MKKILSLKALTPGVRGPGGYIKDTYLPSLALSVRNRVWKLAHSDPFSESRLWLKDAACAPFHQLLALRFHEGFFV